MAERGAYLRQLCRGSNLRVQAYSSPDSGCPLAKPNENIAVCSYEKGNSAVNKLVSSGSVDKLCCVIVDEFHMMADEGRGAALEVSSVASSTAHQVVDRRHLCAASPRCQCCLCKHVLASLQVADVM